MTIYFNEFPHLRQSRHRLTSALERSENCIAHAAGASGEWWEPVIGRYWPLGPPYYNYKIESLVRVFERLGYELCDSVESESGYEKIAIYGIDNVYTHAARQLADGTWTSKLGPEDDISHAALNALAGGCYGSVVRILKRVKSNGKETQCCESSKK
jgi:hypothetical protein